MLSYYWRWLKTAFTHAIGFTDLWMGIAGAVLAVIDHYWPEAKLVTLYGWMIPVFALAAVMAGRLLIAPYWMWLEDQEDRKKLQSIAAVGASLLTRKQNRQATIDGLERLIERSWELRREKLTSEAEYKGWRLRYLEWFAEAADFIQGHVSHISAHHFRQFPSLSMISPFVEGVSDAHKMDLSRLADKHNELEKHLAFARDAA